MTARLILLLALLGALILAYVIVLRVAPPPALPASARPSTGSPGESRAVRPIFRQGQLDPVTLTIRNAVPEPASLGLFWSETIISLLHIGAVPPVERAPAHIEFCERPFYRQGR